MAKSKPEDLNNDVTFNGQSIDPEIQRKVDQYMDLEEPDPAPEDAVLADESVVESPAGSTEPNSESAPLLPTDQLPDSVKEDPVPDVEKPKGKSIAVKDLNEEPDPAPSAPELPGEGGAEEDSPASEPAESDKEPAPEEEEEDEPEEKRLTEDEANELTIADEPELEDEASENIAEEEVAETPEAETEPVAEPEPVPAIDAENLAAPAFEEKPVYDGKTIADAEREALPLDDPQTAKAIDEIIAADADKLLEIEDAKKESAPQPVAAAPPRAKKAKKGNIFKRWFTTPLYRNLTIVAVVVAAIGVGAYPDSRYFVLNSAGVRVSTSVRALDESTALPLKNVEVVVDGKSAKTDSEGTARVEGVRLGQQTLLIKKPAFAEVTRQVTLGWGSNPLGDFSLRPVGTQYVFKLTDFLSGKPVTKGEISYEEASAKINDKGEAKITIPNTKQEEITIQVSADNYRSEKVTVNTTVEQEYAVQLVPAKKHLFFSKRSGKVDLYTAYVDGKEEAVLLSGSGIERDDSLGIAPHPAKNISAFTSSRENVRNKDGYLLNTLQLIDLETKEITKVAQSERIQIIDWAGDRLVYVKTAQGASQADPKRHRLMSFDIGSKTEVELASSNYFNDVLSVNGALYYSPALYQVNGNVGLYKINADGTNKKTIFQKEVWNLFRTGFDTVSLSVGQDWYELNLNDDSMKKVGGAPSVLKSRVYVKSPDGKRSVWIDERDGKTVLIVYDHGSKKDSPLITQSGIKNPIRWLDDDHLVYRVANGQETADFVISLSGGEPKKIVDVMNSYGIDRWYYF